MIGRFLIALLGGAVLMLPPLAKAQAPTPRIPDVNQRSGLITRFVPITPHLPPDPDRDYYHNTRWSDSPSPAVNLSHPNNIFTGGLYGLRWKNGCTASFSPYFIGSPGENTLGPDCGRKPFRLITNFVHPFKPVGVYYQNGSYVPVYDLDPTVPGPGPFPYPFFLRRHNGG